MKKGNTLSYSKIVILGFLVYFFSYSMRLDYSASLVAIVNDLGVSNTTASIAITGSLITYGVGQMLFGFVGDRFSPIKIITIAMLGTITANILVSFCSSITLITVLWCFNGVFQAMIWPPLCRFVAEHTKAEEYSNAITSVGLSASVGTIFIYLFVPALLEATVWRNVFRCMGIFGFIIMLLWCYFTKNVKVAAEEKPKVSEDKKVSVFGMVALAGLVPIFLIIILQGILRDGIQTWLPSMINSEFNMSESSAILSTAVLPVLSIVSVILSNFLFRRFKNEILTASIIFSIAAIATIPLAFGLKIPAFMSVFLAALISGCMHGVNHMVISLIPKSFYRYGMVATFSGILNAFTYVGASLSTYGFAAIADSRFGWGAVRLTWSIVGIAGAAICIYEIKGWTKFIRMR